VTTPTDTRRDLLTVIARMHAKPGKEQELRTALEALIEPTSREKGYVNYDLHQGVEDPGWFFFYENWESADDLDAHLNAAPGGVRRAARRPARRARAGHRAGPAGRLSNGRTAGSAGGRGVSLVDAVDEDAGGEHVAAHAALRYV
jgi:quinol monooxygenase YgiN